MNTFGASAAPICALKGAMANVFLAMVLDPTPQTIKGLEQATGYTYKPVRQALDGLHDLGLIIHDEQHGFWLLKPDTPLLWRLQEAAPVAGEQLPSGFLVLQETAESAPSQNELSTELSTARTVVGEMPTQSAESPHPNGLSPTAAAAVWPEASGINPKSGGQNATADGKIPLQGQEQPSANGGKTPFPAAEYPTEHGESPDLDGESPASRALHTTTAVKANPSHLDNKAASKHSPQNRRSAQRLSDKQRLIYSWLTQGGVGPHSPKMEQLLQKDLPVHTVKAHVLERLACERGLVSDRPDYSVGLLIRKLLDGDPPPPLRCQHCLALPDRNGHCRCSYDQVVSR